MSTATDRPASILRETKAVADPAVRISGMPPNFGEQLMPHVVSFVGITAGVARVYRPSDEALKNSFENARFMLNDIMVTECLEQRRRSTALLDWHLEPDNEQDPKQKWLAEQLQAILETTPNFMQFRESLLYAIWYGRYANQLRYRWKKIRGEMRLAIDRWYPVNGDKLVFRFDDGTGTYDCDQVGIRVGAGFTSGHSVSKRWGESRLEKVQPTDYGLAYFLEDWERPLLTIHRHMIEDGEYEDPLSAGRINGVGIRHRVYWAWYQKQESLAFLMEYLERSASGIEIWYYPWGNSDARERTQKAAEERIGAGRNIVLVPRPMGEEGMAYGVERIEPSMAGADALDRIIREFFGHQIKRYILGQTLTTEAGSTGLGSNLASVHLDTYMQIIRYDATNLEETMTTEVVEPVKAFNFPQYADIPVRFKIDTEAPDVESKLAAWEKAYQMGLKLKAQDVMDLIGASKPDSKDEVLQDPQHRQAAMQEQQAAQQQAAAQAQQANGRRAQAQGFDPRERQAGAVVDHVNLTEALAERGLAASQYDAVDGSAKSENAEREKLRAYAADDALARGCKQEQAEHGFDIRTLGDASEIYKREAVTANAAVTQILEAIRDLPAMPGYGHVYYDPSSKHAWITLGDSDGQEAFERWQAAMESLPEVARVSCEAEAPPPDWRRPGAKRKWIRINRNGRVLYGRDKSEQDVPTVAVDLDGTLAEYDGWKGDDVIERPRPGARRLMLAIKDTGARIIIFTTRGNVEVVEEWLKKFDIPYDYINENPSQPDGTSGKVIADVYWDDRAVSADGPLENSAPEVIRRLTAEPYSKLRERIAQAAAETDTDPSDEAKQAGNYRKGKVRLHGLEITIENPRGSIRRGTDRTGKAWSITMPHHYGYIRRTESEADGDHVDVFIGPHPESEVVFVVDQVKGESRRFDEHKVMIGWTSERKAREAYLAAYSPGWQGLGEITAMTMPQFKAWLEHGDTGSRAADQVSRYGRRGERIVLEEGRDWASCYAKKWNEAEHPRGQPENAGEFVAKDAPQATSAKRTPPGSQMPEEMKARLKALGMVGTFPPADVPMSEITVADLSAADEELRYTPLLSWTQTTKSGRKSRQYRYTQAFHERNAGEKFQRVSSVLPFREKIGRALKQQMQAPTQRDREAAAIASVILETGLRPTDGAESVKHGHYGIGSLEVRHVTIKGNEAHLDFIGKEGIRNQTVVRDPANVAFLAAAIRGKSPTQPVFAQATSDHAAQALREAAASVGAPTDVKLKDLRTMVATIKARQMVESFQGPPPPLSGNMKKDAKAIAKAILTISAEVAKVLNNTPTMARDNYIHPEVWKVWQSKLQVAH